MSFHFNTFIESFADRVGVILLLALGVATAVATAGVGA